MKKTFWWIDLPVLLISSLYLAAILIGIYLLFGNQAYEPTSEWYVLAFALPLMFLIIPWTRPFMVKGDRFVVGLAKFLSFRRYAISVNDIQKMDL